MSQINPYRCNCEVIKKFFSNPVILIISILFFISSIASVTISFIFEIQPDFPVIELLYAIGFLLFYIKGRKKSEVTSFGLPINTLTTASIVSIIANILALVVIALLLALKHLFNFSENILSYYILDDPLYLLTFYSPICVMSLVSSMSLLVLLSSIKKSSKSIYLYKKGSLFFSITSFVFAVLLIGYIVYAGFSISSICKIIEVILLIILGIFAIMYNRYITDVSSNIIVPVPVKKTVNTTPAPVPISKPEQNNPVRFIDPHAVSPTHKKKKPSKKPNYDSALVNIWDATEKKNRNVYNSSNKSSTTTNSFKPQPAFVQKNTAPFTPIKNAEPVVNEPAPIEHRTKSAEEKSFLFCTFCGKKCPPENLYCGSCGNKLTK